MFWLYTIDSEELLLPFSRAELLLEALLLLLLLTADFSPH